MINESIKKKVLENSISLKKIGSNGWAWKKQDAIEVIKVLMNQEIGILGGDVYCLKNNIIEILYDNWSCDELVNEDRESFFIRSKKEAINYILKYPINPKNCSGEVVFSMVFSDYID